LNTAPWNTIKISCALFSHNLVERNFILILHHLIYFTHI